MPGITDLDRITYSENFNGKSGRLEPQIKGFRSCDHGTIEPADGDLQNTTERAQTWIARFSDGWGKWGFQFQDPDVEGLKEGDEVWFRVKMKFPEDFNFRTDVSKVKGFRIGRREIDDPDANRGYIDWYIHSQTLDWSSIVEFDSDRWADHRGGRVEPGQWQTFEVYAKFHPLYGTMRMWRDGVLFAEETRPTISGGSKASQVDRLLFLTYWNGMAPATQGMEFDDVAVAVKRPGRDDTAHMSTDSEGNYLIGMADSGTAPPIDPPIPPIDPPIPPIDPPIPPIDPPIPPIDPPPVGDTSTVVHIGDDTVHVASNLTVVVLRPNGEVKSV